MRFINYYFTYDSINFLLQTYLFNFFYFYLNFYVLQLLLYISSTFNIYHILELDGRGLETKVGFINHRLFNEFLTYSSIAFDFPKFYYFFNFYFLQLM